MLTGADQPFDQERPPEDSFYPASAVEGLVLQPVPQRHCHPLVIAGSLTHQGSGRCGVQPHLAEVGNLSGPVSQVGLPFGLRHGPPTGWDAGRRQVQQWQLNRTGVDGCLQ